MTIEILRTLFNRDLNRLKLEIDSYSDEGKIWHIEKLISNSGGNLCLHLIGNLNTYIGAQIGNTNYIRNRDLEFSNKFVPKSTLIAQIDAAIVMINNTLDQLLDEDLKHEHPYLVFENKTSAEYLLIHLTTHLAYHLGQINYHRRLLDN
ncbi:MULTISPECIES: DinB family protein [Flavobacterium]|uniref:DinB family protein n=1 Tax=Flavobacterium TaxID=237 RepID=UPI00188D08EE|nr:MULTISPECIES: DinB family protein [Flavobacterium]MBF4470840.1 DinB family protein [Flavobacterium sp. HJJ]